MKIVNSASPLIVSEGFDNNASIMGMTSEAALEMTRHLRDTVYTNKILAVVRELGSNLQDEHCLHNIDKNGEIGIRDIDGQHEFFARDFAKGLSENGVRNIFGAYGNSQKRMTNIASGMLGIGAKSPFCYTDTYYVISYFGGEKTTYTLALGGDDKGSSNGFIYKTHSEPSNETGLEVIVPIKSSDLSKFSTEIRQFVVFSPHKIKAQVLGVKITPHPIISKETIDGIDFTLFEGSDNYSSNIAILQMGGVKYETMPLPDGFNTKTNHALVVNVPIGSMTVALSRESFHDTPSNQNFKNKISKYLEQMTQRDFAHLTAKPLKTFIDENLGELHVNKQVEGAIFKTRISYVYPETSKLIGNLAYVDHGQTVQKNNKPLLVLIPNNKATDHWKSKLRSFAQNNKESYYIACAKEFSDLSHVGLTEINQYFTTIGAKSLKFPKIAQTKEYTVYFKDRNKGKVNAVGFANLIRQHFFDLPVEKDLAALKTWIQDEKNKAIQSKDACKLQELSIACIGKSRQRGWTCQSFELAQSIKNLGLFDRFSGEYTTIIKQWEKEGQEARSKQDKIESALKSWTSFNPRTIKLVNKGKNSERLNKFWSSVMSENTTRTKIFTHIQSSYMSYYGIKNKLTRQEFRAIMRLHDA
jgi:hypothetical protein